MSQTVSSPAATVEGFDPQTAKGLTVDLYYGRYESTACAWNRPDGRPGSVTVVAIRDETVNPIGKPAPLQPLPASARAPFTATPERPAAVLVKRRVGRVIWHIEPLAPPEAGHTSFMAGGCYAGTSDSRFGEITGFYGAVSVHDFSEMWAQYNANFD